MKNIDYKYIDNIFHNLIKKQSVNIKVLGKENIKIDISGDSTIRTLKFILSQLFPKSININLYTLINLDKKFLEDKSLVKEIEFEETIYMVYTINNSVV